MYLIIFQHLENDSGCFQNVFFLFTSELRRSTIPIFYDMMQVEFAEERNFEKVSGLNFTVDLGNIVTENWTFFENIC